MRCRRCRRHVLLPEQVARQCWQGGQSSGGAGIALGPPEPQVSLPPCLQAADKALYEIGTVCPSFPGTCSGPEISGLSKGLCVGLPPSAGDDRSHQPTPGTVTPGLSASKFPSAPVAGAGPPSCCTHRVLGTSFCSHRG